MADEIIVETSTPEIIEIGLVGPQGPKGDRGDPGDVSGSVEWDNVTGKPSTFTPSAHTHTPSEVGLGNVSNTAQVTAVTGTAPIVSSGGTTPAISITEATTSAAGSMSGADKLKLDGIAAGAEVNVNADWNASSGDAQILNKPTLGTAAAQDTTAFAASGSITTSGLTQSTARILGRTTASTGAVEEIQIGSGLSLSAGQLSATGSGVTAVGTTLADILSVSGSDLVADDLAADKLYGWDDSESKAIGFIIGSGLSVSGDTLSATASGGSKTYAVFTATENQPTATAFATLDTRNSIAVLDFDAATDESAVFVGIIPEGASLGSGLKVFIHWMASTATSGNCRWGVQFEKSGTDLDSDSFDTATEAHSAANGTSGIETVTEITATAIDSLAAGDRFRLKVFRNADDATNDTMTGDAELIAVEVRSAA